MKSRLIAPVTLFVATLPAHAIEVHYRCTNGTALSADFMTPPNSLGTARLTFDTGGSPVDLPQQMAADGGRYAMNGVEFWIKGDTAQLTRDGAAASCVAKP